MIRPSLTTACTDTLRTAVGQKDQARAPNAADQGDRKRAEAAAAVLNDVDGIEKTY